MRLSEIPEDLAGFLALVILFALMILYAAVAEETPRDRARWRQSKAQIDSILSP